MTFDAVGVFGLTFDFLLKFASAYCDGSVKALSQILYGQYHILELYVLDLITKVFCRKKTRYIFSWTRDSQCQNSAYSLAKITPNASKHFSPICLPKPKSLGSLKKNSLCVRSPWYREIKYLTSFYKSTDYFNSTSQFLALDKSELIMK